jgi:benzodiazapine receptor
MKVLNLLLLAFGLFRDATAFQPSRRILTPTQQHPTNNRFHLASIQGRKTHTQTHSRPCTSASPLYAVNPLTWWCLGHVAGGCLGVPLVTGATRKGSWYRKIDLPPWTPPDSLFAPVWTTLYVMMGIAVGTIFQVKPMPKAPLMLWAVHAALNVTWVPVFFGMRRLRLGMAVNLALVTTLLGVISLFYTVKPVCAFLLLPYLGWVTFATVLNWDICRRNPTKGGYNNAMLQADICKLQRDAAKYAGV